MPLKLFEYKKQFLIGAFLIKLTQFGKTGVLGEIVLPLENLLIKFHFRN